MIRTQIQLEQGMYEKLRELAMRERRSLASMVRESVDLYVAQKTRPRLDPELERALQGFEPEPLAPDDYVKPLDAAYAEAILASKRAD